MLPGTGTVGARREVAWLYRPGLVTCITKRDIVDKVSVLLTVGVHFVKCEALRAQSPSQCEAHIVLQKCSMIHGYDCSSAEGTVSVSRSGATEDPVEVEIK